MGAGALGSCAGHSSVPSPSWRARELTRRLGRIFLRDDQGRRAVFGDDKKRQTDLHFRDSLLVYEYFHGDTGRGAGASHQTGWTGVIATLLQPQRGEEGDAWHLLRRGAPDLPHQEVTR